MVFTGDLGNNDIPLLREPTMIDDILNESMVFSAYSDMTRKSTVLKELVDIIQIIKYEWGQIPEIYPFADMVRTRYKEWIFERNANKGANRKSSLALGGCGQ